MGVSTKPVSLSVNDGVADIASAVARGEVTPTEVVEQILERIETLEPRVQAWSQLDADGARKQAEVLTREAAAGKLRGPLHGVPVNLKEWFHIEGFPTLVRSGPPRPEPEDATCVTRLRAAGAIILGKTHVPLNG